MTQHERSLVFEVQGGGRMTDPPTHIVRVVARVDDRQIIIAEQEVADEPATYALADQVEKLCREFLAQLTALTGAKGELRSESFRKSAPQIGVMSPGQQE